MSSPEIKYQKNNPFLAKLLNLIIGLNKEQQRLLLKEVEDKFLKEKRSYVRKNCKVPVRYINKNRICNSFIVNFSHDGCFIKTADPLIEGEEILMDIGVDSPNKAIRIKGIVAHGNRVGIGIKYKEIITINSEV